MSGHSHSAYESTMNNDDYTKAVKLSGPCEEKISGRKHETEAAYEVKVIGKGRGKGHFSFEKGHGQLS